MQLKLSSPKIWFYQESVDFRKAIDGLVCLVRSQMDINPTDGIFVFRNRTKDKLKLLAWHGNGFVLLYKRIEEGKFTIGADQNTSSILLDEKQLSWLLAGLEWEKMSRWNELEFNDFY